MKKYTYLSFIPVLGIVFGIMAIVKENLFENLLLYLGCAIYQGICSGVLLHFIL